MEEPPYDAFAAARLSDSLKVIEERRTVFEVADHAHTAVQDLANGGWIEETITIRWRPRRVQPESNGYRAGEWSAE